MAQQLDLKFSDCTIKNINLYREAPKTESTTDGAQVKLTPSQQVAIKAICKEHNLKVSTLIREALDNYIDLFPYREKLSRHRRLLRDLIDKLS